MFGTVLIASISAIEEARLENAAFQRSLEGLPVEEKQRRIERREDIFREESFRRARLKAIETSKKRDEGGIGMAKLIFGAALMGSIMRD